MSSINNWLSGESDLAKVQVAQAVLEKVKRERYGHGRKYHTVKTCDHPLTFKEVLISIDINIPNTIDQITQQVTIQNNVITDAEIVEEDVIEEVDFSELVTQRVETEDDIDECEIIDDGLSDSKEIMPSAEEILGMSMKLRNIDFGFGPGTVEINIHD
jgi:hypothetical protein